MRNQGAQHFPPAVAIRSHSGQPPTVSQDDAAREYLHNSWGARVDTNIVITETLRRQYPELFLTVCPTGLASLLSYAQTGHAEFLPLIPDDDPVLAPITQRRWLPPARTSGDGLLVDTLIYGKYTYKWQDHDFILYVVNGGFGSMNNYILSTDAHKADALIVAASRWSVELHNEIWVFDGFWSKSREMWQSVQQSEWEDVILDAEMKKTIRYDIDNFYKSKESYERLNVPWKRGLIFHGPPGNGKTISIKATMHDLQRRTDPIPTLYVRSMGSAFAVMQVFGMARQQAPCFLVFEDLDSLVMGWNRSYFLNEVDGLQDNDGILMVGTTNHLDRLDPGLSKRPSRFDRKYLFPDPSLAQRTAYARYWQKKLTKTDVVFPDELCPAVASITDSFSFAYIQEAFVASLLALARNGASLPLREKPALDELLEQMEASVVMVEPEEPDLDDIPLWCELKKQIAILREGLDSGRSPTAVAATDSTLPRPAPAMGMEGSMGGGAASWTGMASGLLEQMQEHVGVGQDGLARVIVDQ